MPTPLGHALGGLATAWIADSIARKRRPALAIACMAAAVLPDIDILLLNSHRTYTHSLGAILAVGVMTWVIARRRTSAPMNMAVALAAAYGTHVLLDWLGKDTAPQVGLMALWPFSSRFYISGADLFMEISRRYWKFDEFIVGNLQAAGWEVLVVGPVAALAWWLRGRLLLVRSGSFSTIDDKDLDGSTR